MANGAHLLVHRPPDRYQRGVFMEQQENPPDFAPDRFQKRGFSLERWIRFFFASNAGLTIVILALIIIFLLKEGAGFFPGYRRELEVYRKAGLEFVDISRANLTAHEQLGSVLNRAYYAEINGHCVRESKRSEQAAALFNAYTEQTSAAAEQVVNSSPPNGSADPGLLESMRAAFETRKAEALASLPPTPDLTDEERAALIDSLRHRGADATDDPPLVAALAAEIAAARERAALPLQEMRGSIDAFGEAASDLNSLVSEMTEAVTATKESMQAADALEKNRQTLLAAAASAKDPDERTKLAEEAAASVGEKPDLRAAVELLLERRPACIAAHAKVRDFAAGFPERLPQSLSQTDAKRLLAVARKTWPVFLAGLDRAPSQMNDWKFDKPVPLGDAIVSFLTGKDWITGGGWQDFYGILPLAAGSLMISIVALTLAIPAGIGAAIYVNQFATRFEQSLVKPVIEFIQAIPSVVLGFIGILVFGTVLRNISTTEWLQWVPGFPIDERLNIFTAGCLLALMSVPTIFSLAEDAINNVPSAYAEASEALGASRAQTTFRVVVPAAFSGILAAVLLGFGRVIGETMVVLLVAGNRIKIPDFSSGLGAFFQPSHTLTGIIAQELGEVPMGSVHYRALFVVGILLFAVVLAINATAHRFVSRKHP